MPDFPAAEKVRVLLAEYAALRSEIVARTNHGYQLLVVATAAMAFFAAIYTALPWLLLLVIGTVMSMVYVLASWFVLRDIYKLAARVRDIEIDVNDRCGEDLLLWENLSGAASTGFWIGFRPLPREELEKAPTPIRTSKGKFIAAADASGQDKSS